MATEAKCYLRNPAVSTTAVESDLFLVEPEGQDVYYLDAVTSGIWRLLEMPHDREAIFSIYSQAFPDVGHRKIADDITTALDDMIQRGLVVRVPERPGSEKSDP
ncbi:MAG: hypothetical protein COA65_01970 [Rhodospirillaceae bacterium]|nr:MAG: hypothetical protein COA65_01970 [Rhodospirillaceae bacterium]